MKKNIQKLWKLINSSQKILLVNHIKIDWDAFGSLIAFYKILEKLWKTVKATNDESPPENFKFLWSTQLINPELNIKEFNPDLIIMLDIWWEERAWKIYTKNKEIFEKKDFVVIDHHITNKWFWKINIIEHKSSSTCEIVFKIFKKLDMIWYIDKEIATLLITWIITDTNIYYNSNTTSETLKTASELMELWANYRLPIFHFFRKKELKKSRLWWEVLKNLKSSEDWKIVWGIVKKHYFEKTNTTKEETTGLINEFLANIEWAEISFLLYPIENWKTKASFRSTGKDISKFCSEFWWWGHKQAAGFYSDENIEIVEKKILERLM